MSPRRGRMLGGSHCLGHEEANSECLGMGVQATEVGCWEDPIVQAMRRQTLSAQAWEYSGTVWLQLSESNDTLGIKGSSGGKDLGKGLLEDSQTVAQSIVVRLFFITHQREKQKK